MYTLSASNLRSTSKTINDNKRTAENEMREMPKCKAKIKSPNSDIIQFSMEDKGLYLYVDNILKKEGRFSDRSHNNEIMQISKEDLVHLLTNCLIPKDEQDEILRKCEEITSQKFKFSDVATKMIDKFIEGFTTAAGTSAWVFTKANMLNLIQYIF